MACCVCYVMVKNRFVFYIQLRLIVIRERKYFTPHSNSTLNIIIFGLSTVFSAVCMPCVMVAAFFLFLYRLSLLLSSSIYFMQQVGER